jgi:hypothetical protein
MLLLSVLLLGAALPAAAQPEGPDPDSLLLAGVVAGGPAVSEHHLQSRCLELPGGWADPELRPRTEGLPSSCATLESGELERAGDRRYFWTRYAHRTALAPLDPARPGLRDTLREEEVVLLSAPLEGGRLTPEWHIRYDLDYIVDVRLEIGPHDEDGALVSVLGCVNGTAGCRQQFLLRRGDGWRVVRQAWMDQLPDSVDGEFWKGAYINPMTLQGRAPLYGQDDANCCPSRMLYVRVRLDGDALALRDYRAITFDDP